MKLDIDARAWAMIWAVLTIVTTHTTPLAATERQTSGLEWVEVGYDPLKYDDYVVLRDNGLYVRSNLVLSYWSWFGQTDQLQMSRQTTVSRDCGGAPTSDGQFVVRFDASNGLSVYDATTCNLAWQDRKACHADCSLVTPTPNKGEIVVLYKGWQLRRWTLATGQRLPDFLVRARVDAVVGGRSFAGANWIRVATPTGNYALINSLNGKALRNKLKGPQPSDQYILDQNHVIFDHDRNDPHGWLLWDIPTDRAVGPLHKPEGFSDYRFQSSIAGPGQSLTQLWIELPDYRSAYSELHPEPPRKAMVAVVERGADNHWSGPARVFEAANFPLAQLQLAPDERHLLGWGESGVVVWNTDTGKRILELPTKARERTFGCIDPFVDHLALAAGDSLLIVDIATGKARSVWVPPAEGQFCVSDGVIRSNFIPLGKDHRKRGAHIVVRWDWLGRAHPYPDYVYEGEPPLDDETGAWSEPPMSGSGYTISKEDMVCRNDECRNMVNVTGSVGHTFPLGYILDGRALVGFAQGAAHILTPDGQRMLGVIRHAGSGGWIYVDTGSSDRSPRLVDNERLRGQVALEVLHGNANDTLRCATADDIHPWSSCSAEFTSSGSLSKRLATLRTPKPGKP
jgi:hypothetical protein